VPVSLFKWEREPHKAGPLDAGSINELSDILYLLPIAPPDYDPSLPFPPKNNNRPNFQL